MPPVLIVDDDAATLESLAEALELCGYSVATAASGVEALRLALRERPAAALVDLRMPGMSGAEVIARLRTIPGCEALCVILVTAWPELPADLDPLALVIEKPFAMRSLLECLERFGVSAAGSAASPMA